MDKEVYEKIKGDLPEQLRRDIEKLKNISDKYKLRRLGQYLTSVTERETIDSKEIFEKTQKGLFYIS